MNSLGLLFLVKVGGEWEKGSANNDGTFNHGRRHLTRPRDAISN